MKGIWNNRCVFTRTCVCVCVWYNRHNHRILKQLYNSSSLVSSTPSSNQLQFFSSASDSASVPRTQSIATDAHDVSTQELKKLIDRFYGGDQDAIPSIFEAILKRKLTGKYEKEDEELMQEIMRGKPSTDFQDEEFGSDSDESFDTSDEEDSD